MGHSLLNEKKRRIRPGNSLGDTRTIRVRQQSNRFLVLRGLLAPVFSIFVAGSFGVSPSVWRLQKCCHRSRSRPGGYAPIHFELGKVQETRLRPRGRMVSPLEQMPKECHLHRLVYSGSSPLQHVLRRWMRGYCRNPRA